MSELTHKDRLRALRAMRRTVANNDCGAIAPRTLAALMSAAVVFLCMLALPGSVAVVLPAAVGEALLMFYAVKRFGHRFSVSWRSRLDAQLAAYSPVDAGAFEALRQQAVLGRVDDLQVLCWISAEQAAICPRHSVLPRWRFAERT